MPQPTAESLPALGPSRASTPSPAIRPTPPPPGLDRPRIHLSTYGDRDVGLVCRKCGCREFRVVYTRRIPGGIRRLKQCRYCGNRRSTVERD